MKRIRRRKINLEHCRVIVNQGSALITESVCCPDCGRVFMPGVSVETIAACSPTAEKLLGDGSQAETSGDERS